MNHVFRTLWQAGLAVVLTSAVAGSAGCAAEDPEPTPRATVDRNTITAADLGAELTITAQVVRRIDDVSFVVADADLPSGGVLVVAGSPVDVRPPILVTVRGTVQTFDYADRAEGLPGPPAQYRAFDGRRVVIADSVKVWDGPTPGVGSDAAV